MSLTDTYDIRLARAAYWVNEVTEELEHAKYELRAALEARSQRPGPQIGQCGSPAGYRGHHRRRDPKCPACVEAWTWQRQQFAGRSAA